MAEKHKGHLQNGIEFIKSHPQILFTVFTGIVIIGGFLFTSQKFVDVTKATQERYERNRLSSFQDAFIEITKQQFGNPVYLGEVIKQLAQKNETITEFRVVLNDGNYTIAASLKDGEVGTSDSRNEEFYRLPSSNPAESFSYDLVEGGERVFKFVRAIANDTGGIRGWVTNTSALSQFDAITTQNIQTAYMVLLGVIILIVILFVRHARIIDYASLYSRLKEVDQMKDDFISMASHELRSPLTVIRGYTDLAKSSDAVKMVPDEPRKKLSETLELIDTSARQLDSLVADILDVSRLSQGRIEVTPKEVNIAELARTITDSFKMPAEQKGLTISYQGIERVSVFADPDRLRQVIVNLVGNSVKYTKKGSITVEVQENGNNVALRISDTGIGISAEEQKKLFQKFYRIKSEETREITGTGLGLWITAELVRKMNGAITVESIKGVGSHFIVIFAKYAGQSSTATPAVAAHAQVAPQK
jgi:signal transduction histidine kinase